MQSIPESRPRSKKTKRLGPDSCLIPTPELHNRSGVDQEGLAFHQQLNIVMA